VSRGCVSGVCGLWAKQWGGPGIDAASDVAIDVNGDLVIVGVFSGSVNFGGGPLMSSGDPDIFVAKYSPTGEYRWAKRFGGPKADMALNVVTDSAGDIVISALGSQVDFGDGTPKGMQSGLFGDMLIAKLAGANGGHIWSYALSTGTATGYGLAVDKLGDVFWSGSFTTSLMFGVESITSAGASDAFVVKLTAAKGAPVWMKSFGGSSHESARGLGVDGKGDVLVLGNSSSAEVDFGGGPRAGKDADFIGTDLFLLKVSGLTGSHVWSQMFGAAGSDDAKDVAVDASGDAIVTGHIAGVTDIGGDPIGGMSNDALLAKFDGDTGEHRWSRAMGGLSDDLGNDIAVGQTGDVYVLGSFKSSVGDFGGGKLTNPNAPENGSFLAKYAAATGAHMVSAAYGAMTGGFPSSIAVDPSRGNVVLVGSFSGGTNWGDVQLTSAGEADAFLASLGPVP
jgi:hypothetical protein